MRRAFFCARRCQALQIFTKPCGSRVDRHEHIGKGCLGLAPFRRLMRTV